MSSEQNQPLIDWDNSNQQPLSVAVSYEAELTAPAEDSMGENGGVDTGENGVADDVDNKNPLEEAKEAEPVAPEEITSAKTGEQDISGGGAEDAAENKIVNNESLESEMNEQTIHKEEAKPSNSSDDEASMLSGKRGRPTEAIDVQPQAKKSRLDDCSWEDLVSQIHHRLGAMSSDECFVKAIEIAVMARQQVESRSLHLVNAFDMLGKSQSSASAPLSAGAAASALPAVAMPHDPLDQWMAKYVELKQFYQMNGHFDVPLDQPSYEALAKWVLHQRKHASSLNTTQVHLMNKIGFPWGAPRNSDSGAYTYLTESTGTQRLVDDYPHNQQLMKPAAKTKARPVQLSEERGVLTQKQVKMHRTTRFRTLESVPCVKMAPPLPPKADDTEVAAQALVPVFQSLVNFPNARYFGNCVMCDESEYPVPNQNKGVCNNCDSAVWIFAQTGLQIKWCKGCKNFRKWIDFGPKASD